MHHHHHRAAGPVAAGADLAAGTGYFGSSAWGDTTAAPALPAAVPMLRRTGASRKFLFVGNDAREEVAGRPPLFSTRTSVRCAGHRGAA